MNKPVEVAAFSTEAQAGLACGMLHSHGIDAVVVPDEMSVLYGAGSTWAPVRLFVGSDDLAAALDLLKQHKDIN